MKLSEPKRKALIEWIESMPWWKELPYAQLEDDIKKIEINTDAYADENKALKTELRGERERLLTEMYNNDTISQVQFDHAMKEIALLKESE